MDLWASNEHNIFSAENRHRVRQCAYNLHRVATVNWTVKLKDLSRTFQDIFKQNQGPYVPKKLCYSLY